MWYKELSSASAANTDVVLADGLALLLFDYVG